MRTKSVSLMFAFLLACGAAQGNEQLPVRCEVVPLPGRQASFCIDGVEKLRWHYGDENPRPFFFPLNGPSGVPLTRMGHPGAPDHDHHLSVWFAHNDVDGVNFWADFSDARIRQAQWYAYRDGDDEAVMASLLRWHNGDGVALLEQELVAALLPLPNDEHAVEFQLRFTPAPNVETVTLRKTNFGILAVRVAKSISAHFGGGELTNSEGQRGEPNIFGKPARWMDYSGPVVVGQGKDRRTVTEGVTYFDHPANPHYPAHWHVRDDGWMTASLCFTEGIAITRDKPLTVRYLLHAHSGPYDENKAKAIQEQFAQRPGFRVGKATARNFQFEVQRLP